MLTDYVLNKLDTLFLRFHSFRFPKLSIVFFMLGLIFMFSFPNYNLIVNEGHLNSGRITFINKQINNPLDSSVCAQINPKEHESKRAFRILIPSIAHVLHIDYLGVFILETLLGIVFLYLIFDYFLNITNDYLLSCYLLFGVSSIYLGKSAFLDIGAFYDFFAFFVSLLIIRLSYFLVIFTLCVMGSFIDERFIIAMPLLVLFKTYNSPNMGVLLKSASPFVLAVITVTIIRVYLSHAFGLHVPMGNGSDIGISAFQKDFQYLPLGFFSGLEFLWLIIAYALFELIKSGQKKLAIAYSTATFSIIVASFMVFDITRSITYVYPSFLLAILFLTKTNTLASYVNAIKLCCLGCFLFATFYVEAPTYVGWISPIFPKILKLIPE